MNKLVKLVLVRHKANGPCYLFEAPINAQVLEGDTVVCKLSTDSSSRAMMQSHRSHRL